MRQHATARLAAAIALVFATAVPALAATTVTRTQTATPAAGKPSLNNVSSSGTFQSSATTVPAAKNAAPDNVTTTTNAPPIQNVTTVDVRAQQTAAATAGTHSSGSTSALGPLANGGASTVNSSTGTTGTGSSTGTTAAHGAPVVVSPFLNNFSDMTNGGFAAAIPAATGPVVNNGVAGSADVFAGAAVTPNTVVAQAQVNDASFNRAVNQASRDRKRIGRNGQLLNTIAPRTNGVDRSREMPDDGPSPSLSGFNSTLVR